MSVQAFFGVVVLILFLEQIRSTALPTEVEHLPFSVSQLGACHSWRAGSRL